MSTSRRTDHIFPQGTAIRDGILRGLLIATAFSAFVLLTAASRDPREPVWQIVGYYYAAGLLGGAIFGLLRPWQNRYAGKLLTAYLVLFLIYGGGTTVFLPTINQRYTRPLSLASLLSVWAVLCAVLAPIYVKLFDGPGPSGGTA